MLEHGAYRLLLDYYYSNGGPIPADFKNIYRACSAFTPTERRAVEKVIQKYFTRDDGVWRNPRADLEIKKQIEISDKAREKANQRWKVNMPQHMPVHMQVDMPPTPTPTPKKGNINGRANGKQSFYEAGLNYQAKDHANSEVE
jgi:uncharacterized protein YdaU (DUF1376 family)